jgi:hypothetical protein
MFQAKVVEKLNTHILYSVKYFLENRAGYEITRKKRSRFAEAKDDKVEHAHLTLTT